MDKQYFLIKFKWYQSLGDGEHDYGNKIQLVIANNFEEAVEKLKLKFKHLTLSNFKNETIE